MTRSSAARSSSVGDEHVAAVRALLANDVERGLQLTGSFIESGHADGYGLLLSAAFVAAVQRRFSPTWTLPQVVRFVGDTRVDLWKDDIDIDPRTAEALIRRALGDRVDVRLQEEASARAQIFLLLVLIDDEGIDGAGLDAFLAQARSLADQLAERAAEGDGGTLRAAGAPDGLPGSDKT